MKRFVIVHLVIIALFFAGCTLPTTNTTVPVPTTKGMPVGTSTPQPTVTVFPTTVNVTTTMASGNSSGNGTVSGGGGDLFLIAPLTARYHEGDVITVRGTTILAAGDPLLVEVVSASFGPTPKTSNQFFTGVSGVVNVVRGPAGGPNTWSFSFPTDGYNPDTYIVTVSGLTVRVEDSTTFELLPQTAA
jgi:hypothetical protein